jgi:hypothetical protein
VIEPDRLEVEPEISPETIDAAGLEMDDRDLDREPVTEFGEIVTIEDEPIVTELSGEEPPYLDPDDEFAEFEATPVIPRNTISTPVSAEVVTAIGSPPTRSAVADDEDWEF